MQTETDPILEEVYRLRDEHAKQFNYDLDAIVADIQSRSKKSGRMFVTLDGSTDAELQNVIEATHDQPRS